MLKKILFLIFTFVVFSNANFTLCQDGKIANLKFSFSDFKKPSEWSVKLGLLKFDSTDKFLAVSGEDNDVAVYEVDSGKLLSKLTTNSKARFQAFSFSPDGKSALLQKTYNGNLMLFEPESGKLIREINVKENHDAGNLTFNSEAGLVMLPAPISPDWKNILIGINLGEFEVIDFETGKSKFTLKHSEKPSRTGIALKNIGTMLIGGIAWLPVRNGLFSPNGKFILLTNGNESPSLWDAETGKLIATLEPQSNHVYISFFSPDSKTAITFNNDGIFSLWNTEDGKLVSSFETKEKKIFPRTISPDGEKVITSTLFVKKKDAKIWNLRNGSLFTVLEKCESNSLSYSPNGKLIASTPFKQKQLAQIWDAQTGKLLVSIPRKKEENTLSLAWTPNSEFLITSSKDNVKIWSTKGELIQTLENARYPIGLSEDGKFLATGGQKDMGYVWQIK